MDHERREQGLTLMEVMVVVILLTLIATAVAAAVLPALESARRKQTLTDVHTIRLAVKTWLIENQGCPTIDQLPLDRDTRLRDAWDNEFVIVCDADSPSVFSVGPDGQPDTPDDVRMGGRR